MTLRTATDASLLDVPSAKSEFRTVNDIELHVVTAGDEDDPLVVLLHGFPEFWYSWHRHVDSLVEAGYRVLVPDQRGYNHSEKPDGIRPYRLPELSRDIVELVDTEGRDSAHLVGHDWGATVAWDVALRHPDTVDRLGILNVPHPSAFYRTILSNPRQLLRSWYILFFQLPRIPEWFGTRRDYGAWVSALRDQSKPGTFTEEDFSRYRVAWSRKGVCNAMLNWYRAMVRHAEDPPRERVTSPTMVIWGEEDHALVPELAPKSVEYCEDGRLERFPNATHWVHHEYPDRVTDLLLDHLGE